MTEDTADIEEEIHDDTASAEKGVLVNAAGTAYDPK